MLTRFYLLFGELITSRGIAKGTRKTVCVSNVYEPLQSVAQLGGIVDRQALRQVIGVEAVATAAPQDRHHPAEEQLRPWRHTLARIAALRFARTVHVGFGCGAAAVCDNVVSFCFGQLE